MARSRTPIRRALAIAVGLAAAFLATVLGVYVIPQQQSARASNGIVILGPVEEWRTAWGLELLDDGVADELVISTPNPSETYEPLCDGRDPRVTCFVPEPFTTQGEAREIAALMADRGWEAVTVLTVTPHLTRSVFIIGRCVPGDAVQVLGRPGDLTLGDWFYQVAYQTAGWAKALFVTTGC